MRRCCAVLAEAALLGLPAASSAVRWGISFHRIGQKRFFGVAARPRLIVYPVAVALTVVVAILFAFPAAQAGEYSRSGHRSSEVKREFRGRSFHR